MTTLFAAVAVIGIAMLVMALGFIVQKKSLRGSCGGSEVLDCDGESLSCAGCPNRKDRDAGPRRASQNELIRELMGGGSSR